MTTPAKDRPTCRGICVGSGKPCTRPIPVRVPGITRTKEQLYCFQHRSQAQGGHFGLRLDSDGRYATVDTDESDDDEGGKVDEAGYGTDDGGVDWAAAALVAAEVEQAHAGQNSHAADLDALTGQLEGMGLAARPPVAASAPAVDELGALLDSFNSLSVVGAQPSSTPLPPPIAPAAASSGLYSVTRPMPMPSTHVSTVASVADNGPSPIGFDPAFLRRRMADMARPPPMPHDQPAVSLAEKPLPPLPPEANDSAEAPSLPTCSSTPTGVSSSSGWLPTHLPDAVKARLLVEMRKPVSKDDKPGYIYVYQLRKGPIAYMDPNYEFYKIGRTSNLARRLMQWSRQCGYRPRMIDCFPNASTLSEDAGLGMMHGKLRPIVLGRGIGASSQESTYSNADDSLADEVTVVDNDEYDYCGDTSSDGDYDYLAESDHGSEGDSEYFVDSTRDRTTSTDRAAINASSNQRAGAHAKDDVSAADAPGHPMSPFSHRLERLIHLELTEQHHFTGLECEGCRTIHQEWFKVARKLLPTGDSETNATTSGYHVRRTAWPGIREVVVRWTRYVDTLSADVAESDA
ncbi:hypothetical protein THASP1DRAFT_31816 [Thamnocephalis sphaerospora]|uniref:Bacteriophage T5 Orf172 DNA-binding domain-containing protein n=1 Tax=Thamnocephalis sphaerospora TaxID=78915 RepID=A0A4P9XKM7_9FUNG|nr:hypothetical protein THASP1DRAFT_31816 [Thamnocephalis sphaerospora]|eukprot:RKP06364.1 hypothetical protein THASP1DRAFT_31816 [Thamnocephalis sphaerospora]